MGNDATVQSESWIHRAGNAYNAFIDSVDKKTSCHSVQIITLNLNEWSAARVIATLAFHILTAIVVIPGLIIFDLASRGVVWIKNKLVGEAQDDMLSTDGQTQPKGPANLGVTTDEKHSETSAPPSRRPSDSSNQNSTPGSDSQKPSPPNSPRGIKGDLGGSFTTVSSDSAQTSSAVG